MLDFLGAVIGFFGSIFLILGVIAIIINTLVKYGAILGIIIVVVVIAIAIIGIALLFKGNDPPAVFRDAEHLSEYDK